MRRALVPNTGVARYENPLFSPANGLFTITDKLFTYSDKLFEPSDKLFKPSKGRCGPAKTPSGYPGGVVAFPESVPGNPGRITDGARGGIGPAGVNNCGPRAIRRSGIRTLQADPFTCKLVHFLPAVNVRQFLPSPKSTHLPASARNKRGNG